MRQGILKYLLYLKLSTNFEKETNTTGGIFVGQYDTSEEITMVEKEISLGLSEEEYGILDSLCGEHGISVGQLFRRFSKDLAGLEYPAYYGFSDWTEEAACAKEWFMHCSFGNIPEESLLNRLVAYRQNIRLLLQLTDLIESKAEREEVREYLERHGTEILKETVEEAESKVSDMETEGGKRYRRWGEGGLCLKHLEFECKNMTSEWAKSHQEADMAKEMEAVREWYGKANGQKDRVWEEDMGGKHVLLRLAGMDYNDLDWFFQEYDVTAGQVFGRLARELVDARKAAMSRHAPRTDGSGRAEKWFTSCSFGRFPEESLVNYLVAYIPCADEVVGMSGALNYIDTDPDRAMRWIGGCILKEWKAGHPDANVKEELLAVKEWYEENEQGLRRGQRMESVQEENEDVVVQRKGRGR